MRRTLAFAGIVALAFGWAMGPVSAGEAGFQITPTSGPGGTKITATDPAHQCGEDSGDQVTVSIVHDGTTLVTTTVQTDLQSMWTATLTLPADAVPGGDYDVTAHCLAISEDGIEFDYQQQIFTVTASAPSTTTTTAAPVTTTTVAPAVAVQAAPAAAPVVAEPAVTG